MLVAAFFPGKKIKTFGMGSFPEGAVAGVGTDILSVQIHQTDNKPSASCPGFDMQWVGADGQTRTERIFPPEMLEAWELPLPGQESLWQILLKRAVCLFAGKLTVETMPWGTLTGIRPGKLIYLMQELGYTQEQRNALLEALYLVNPGKIALLESIATIQGPYLQTMIANPDLVSVYISVPFCPTRCHYCSFPSHLSKRSNSGIIHSYLQVLKEEISLTGAMMSAFGMKADCIYIGGGTPTMLNHGELSDLLEAVARDIPAVQNPEYTVEAGRPDTIDSGKLAIMKGYKVNRISINPQSMHDITLNRIGRRHTVDDVLEAYHQARAASDWTINMDLILGLPGEGQADITSSLQKVIALKPDNITVHALARKRGSEAWQEGSSRGTSQQAWQAAQAVRHYDLLDSGYYPYYLYRQKYIAGNLENIGYTTPQNECRYNIAVIEERQDILGLGAGASNKILHRKNRKHQNIYHSPDINHYLTHYHEVFKHREKLLGQERY